MSIKELHLKPNETLFDEGDQSKNLYFLKTGVIRIFKKKSEGNIEIDTVRAGQVIGELAFFDGLPRSASAEALTSCTLIEISKAGLDEAMAKLPDWLVSLTKTVSSRLRTANNKIRLLENLSTEYEVDRNGNRSREYVYVNTSELLRFCTGLLAVSARYGKNATTEGIEFPSALLEKFAGQILQVSSSKVLSLIELFKNVEILKGDLFLTDIRFLDQFIQYVNDQNLQDPSKKQKLSQPGFAALTLLVQNKSNAQAYSDPYVRVNLGPAIKASGVPLQQFQELADEAFIRNISINSIDEILIDFDPSRIVFLYRAFFVLTEVEKLNEMKRRSP